MELEEVSHRYNATSRDALSTLLEIGADRSQLEAANENNKRTIRKSLESYIYSSALNLYEASRPVTIEPLRLVVTGLTGAGKSATGNTILGENVFPVSSSAASATMDEQDASGSWNTCKFVVVDTPGSWKLPSESYPGGDELYLFVVNLSHPRFDKTQLHRLRSLKDGEGRSIINNRMCVLLLTFAREGLYSTNLVEYIHDIQGDPLEELISKDLDGIRVMAINNLPETEYEASEQRKNLIGFILGASSQAMRERPSRFPLSMRKKLFLGICVLVGILIIVLVILFA